MHKERTFVYHALILYFIFQLCSLVSLQRYTKALSTLQRSSLVEKSRQKPQERMSVLSNVGVILHLMASTVLEFFTCAVFKPFFLQALKSSKYDAEPMLRSCGISINPSFTQVEGRVLPAPKVYIFLFRYFQFERAMNVEHEKTYPAK